MYDDIWIIIILGLLLGLALTYIIMQQGTINRLYMKNSDLKTALRPNDAGKYEPSTGYAYMGGRAHLDVIRKITEREKDLDTREALVKKAEDLVSQQAQRFSDLELVTKLITDSKEREKLTGFLNGMGHDLNVLRDYLKGEK